MSFNNHDTNLETKQKYFPKFVELLTNQFNHGGDKYGFNDKKEYSDVLCELWGGTSGVDWILGTMMKYIWRYKNYGREKDLLKICIYAFILWLKAGYHLNEQHDEDIKK